jgi:long-chain acyl-CoA synthetase
MMATGERNLAMLAEEAFERNGDYESLLFEGTWYRSGDLFERSRRLGAGIVELGVGPGDRVVVLMSNSADVGVVYTALWRAGAAITPVIFLVGADELRRILDDSAATAVLTSPEFLPSVRSAAEGIPTLRWIVVAGPDPGDGTMSTAALEEAQPASIVPRGDRDLAALMYTGGTTGQAKAVMLSHENLWFCGKSATEGSFVSGTTRAIVPLPLSHAFGLIATIVGLHSPEPGVGVLMRWFDPSALLELVQEHRVQRAALVPSMVQILLSMPLEDHDLSSLRYVNVGAAPLSSDVAREFERRVPGVEILEGYGCTESGAVVSVNLPGRRRLGSVGPPIPGYEVKILGNADQELPSGETGEVCVRSPGVMLGYWNEPDLTAQTLRDGWLHTGDLGRVDEDGHLYIVDRIKDLIIRGGFNVYPRDVEDALLEHPDVTLAGVVGKPDERMGEEVMAFVQLAPGSEATPEALMDFVKARLGAHKYPREVRLLPSVPLTPVGKVDRKALRAMR